MFLPCFQLTQSMMISNSFLSERDGNKYFIVVESLCQVLPDRLFQLFTFAFRWEVGC